MTDGTARAFTGGRVLTMVPGHAPATSVVVRGGRIAAVGGDDILGGHPDAVVEDLGGRTVAPGLIDAHHHLSLVALHPRWADLSQATTMAEVAGALAAQAVREPGARWVRGAGWARPEALAAADLDAIGLDRPVMVAHYSLHQATVSSAGLDELGLTATTPDPDGGRIQRDGQGRPTGGLLERAWSEAHARSMADYEDPDRWAELIVERGRQLLAEGVTAVHDAACSPAAEAVYRSLAAAGRLPLSVLALPHPAALFSSPDAARLDGPPTGEGDEWLRVGPVKLFADGGMAIAVDATSAGRRRRAGLLFPGVPDDALAAAERGFRVAVHAMGNAGLEVALDAFEELERRFPGVDLRGRVEHVSLAGLAQLRRMAALGAVGVVQPGMVPVLGANVAHLAFDDVAWMPWADALEAGVRLAASTDAPCADFRPLATSAGGVSREVATGVQLGPDQSLDYLTWLDAWTAGAAFAGGQEGERGRFEPGLRADLVVLDGGLDLADPPRVAQTWVAGRLVHDSRN